MREHLNKPLCRRRDYSAVSAKSVAGTVAAWRARQEPDLKPEVEAVRFYLLNHVMAEIGHRHASSRKLPASVMELIELYHQELSPVAMQMFCYLLLICTREARHLKNKTQMRTALQLGFGEAFPTWLEACPDGEHGSTTADRFMATPPDMLLGPYVAGLYRAFDKGKFDSAFGGQKWAAITLHLLKFVEGHHSPELLLDGAFGLAHNGGPIFNKGMGFQKCGHELLTILDVQASGQIPQLVCSRLTNAVQCPEIVKLYKTCVETLGAHGLAGPVDWGRVTAVAKEGRSYGGYQGTKKSPIYDTPVLASIVKPVNVSDTYQATATDKVPKVQVTR